MIKHCNTDRFKLNNNGETYRIEIYVNIFTILQPAIESKDYVSTGFQLAGPIVFGLAAFFLISKYEKKYGNNED